MPPDPTTIVSTSTSPPLRTTSPLDLQTQTPALSPSISFDSLSLLSPIVPSSFSPSISSLSPGSALFPHTVPRHNIAPSHVSQGRREGGGLTSSLASVAAFERNANAPTDPHRSVTPPPPKVKMSLKDFAMRKRKQREEEMAKQVVSSVSQGSTASTLQPAVSISGRTAAESANPRVDGMEMEGVESREIASGNGEADAMAVDTPAEENTSSFPWGVVDDRESEEQIECSPTHMRSPSPSLSPPPEKHIRPHTSNGPDPLKATFELVDDPMMPTNTPIVKDSQPEPPSPPLNGTTEKRVTKLNPTPSAVKGEQNMPDRQVRKILRRKKNNKEKKERKAYTPDGLDIEDRDFECPFCHRMFERWGIICHL
jgi:hypothetical protein